MPPGTLIEEKTIEGGWYFWDEADLLGGGPYPTEKEALIKLNEYADQLYKDCGIT